ncbi:putative carboxylesterase [Lupinus albus]|uniref:Putative carboxylesterase n=1 Tax=Lupinus albus TaxID=3870 RepID=A0A6A4QZY2_LUPAL|nr:putative carboxylesterase [Lupinus albus]
MALLPLFLILTISAEVEGAKLFVFGDSYVDTGNYLNSPSYKPPYGITYPGYPSGRFSNGRVLTDYLGNFLFPLFALFLDH